MAKEIENNELWLKSKEVEKELKISSCYLAHLRQEGKLEFIKKGDSYLYDRSSIKKV